MHFIGRLDKVLYTAITEKILTDEVIITDERIQHIIERRGQAFYDEYHAYFPLIVATPDFIFRDDRENPANQAV